METRCDICKEIIAQSGICRCFLELQISDLKSKVMELQLLTISQRCRKYHCQLCSWCEDFDCCDNQHPAKSKLIEYENEIKKLKELVSKDK